MPSAGAAEGAPAKLRHDAMGESGRERDGLSPGENLKRQLDDLITTIGDEVPLMESEISRMEEKHAEELKNVEERVKEILKKKAVAVAKIKDEEVDMIKRVNLDMVEELDEKRKRVFAG